MATRSIDGLRRGLLLAGIVAVGACGDDDMVSGTTDMGRADMGRDGGRRDSGDDPDTSVMPELDMSMEEPDMRMPPVDMGMPPVDMGMPPVDMGMPPVDMGMPPVDMGTPGMMPTAAGDLIITEILYDPTAVAEDMGEWIEIFNPGADILFLGGCEIADGSAMGRHVIDPAAGLRVGPGESIVLARSSTPGFVPDYSYADAFALNNAGVETVTLTCGGTVIDRVVYDTASWPDPSGGSITLDPSSYDGIANDSPSAWCAATTAFASGDLGSPQQVNDMCPVVVADAGPMDMGPVDMGPADTGPVDTGPMDAGPMDMGPADMGPRDMGPMDAGPPGVIPSATGQLVITEIMYDPSGAEPGTEWFEVHNPSGTVTYNLIGCVIRDNDGPPGHTIATSVVVAPGAYVTFSRGTGPGFPPTYSYGASGAIDLTNTADDVSITCGGTIIDGVSYDETAGWPVAMNASLNLRPGALDATANDVAANWCLATMMFATGDRGTPNAANTACPAPDAGPMDMGADAADMAIPDMGGDAADMSIPDMGGDAADMSVPDMGSSGVAPSAAGQLVISEIMYNPSEDPETNFEWIEIYNPSTTVTYQLMGCVLSDDNPTTATIATSVVMPPGDYATLARSTMVAFTPDATYTSIIWNNATGGGGGDTVLLTCGGTPIDSVVYRVNNGGWPDVPGGGAGASISLNPTMATLTATANDLAANWCLSTVAMGGPTDPSSPGLPNMACP